MGWILIFLGYVGIFLDHKYFKMNVSFQNQYDYIYDLG